MTDNPAYDALVHLANLCSASAVSLPEKVDADPRQSGVGFSLLGRRFVAPMGQISEILEMPSVTKLPGVQTWVIGLSNVRGRLLPLFDMAQFFGSGALANRKQQRVLVLDFGSLYSGLVVDQSFGMQHFTRELYREKVDDVPEAIAPYVKGEYVDASGLSWAVFDMKAIARDSRFLNAAAS